MISLPEWLIKRLQQALPDKTAQIKMMPPADTNRFRFPENAKKSSVLLLLFPDADDFRLIVIKRSNDGGVHSGQIAFPGGKIEPTDSSPEAAALREAFEEIHLEARPVRILGRLSKLYIPVSNFIVYPILAFAEQKPEALFPSDSEVAQIFTFSLKKGFAQKSIKKIRLTVAPHLLIKAPTYNIDNENFIWGATAMILAEFEALYNEYESLK